MTDHTPEPWEFEGIHVLPKPKMRITHQWEGVAQRAELEANAARIVACVNACAGISQADLELPATNERLRALVKACAGIPTEQLGDVKALVEGLEGMLHFFMGYSDMEAWKKADAALAPFRED